MFERMQFRDCVKDILFQNKRRTEGEIVKTSSTSHSRDKYGDELIQCDWCGKFTKNTVWSYYGRYCSRACKTASRYKGNIGFLFLIVLIALVSIFAVFSIPSTNPIQFVYNLQMLSVALISLSILALVTVYQIRGGYKMRKNEESMFWED